MNWRMVWARGTRRIEIEVEAPSKKRAAKLAAIEMSKKHKGKAFSFVEGPIPVFAFAGPGRSVSVTAGRELTGAVTVPRNKTLAAQASL